MPPWTVKCVRAEGERSSSTALHAIIPRPMRSPQNEPTRHGDQLLVARLTIRDHKRIFSPSHYFAIMKPVQRMNLDTWDKTKWPPYNSYYCGRTVTFNTKFGLSSGAVTGCCSLCEELPNFG